MKKHRVALSKTGQFSSFFLDYLNGKEELKPFYSHLPQLESFKAAIESKQFPKASRIVLSATLARQYQGLEIPEPVST